MQDTFYPKDIWPTPHQTLLLRAALTPSAEAITAWEEWVAAGCFDWPDRASYRLLPLAYHNLKKQGYDAPVMGRLKGIYRRSWCKNQLLFRQFTALLQQVQAAGIQTLALKGVVLSELYYRDHGVRPMGDLDLMIPLAEVPAAATLLVNSGWASKLRPLQWLNEYQLSVRHAWHFEDQERNVLDLHWHLLWEDCSAEADADFWEGAVPAEILGLTVLTLNPADQLLHTCVHGARWNPTAPIRWVADGLTILTQSPALDWERLLSQAEKRRLILPVRETLRYLAAEFQAPIPPAVLAQLESLPVSLAERLEFRSKAISPDRKNILLTVWTDYRRYSRTARHREPLRYLLGMPRYFQHCWAVAKWWTLPGYIIRKSVKVATRRFWTLITDGSQAG